MEPTTNQTPEAIQPPPIAQTPKSHVPKKRLIIVLVIVAVLALLLVALSLYLPQNYITWAKTTISCGKRPAIGIATQANGDFGFTGKTAILPSDPTYNDKIVPPTLQFNPEQHYFYCSEAAAASAGFLTQAAVIKANPAPSYDLATPLYKIQGLIDSGYAIDTSDELVTYGYSESEKHAKYPYYHAKYRKPITTQTAQKYDVYYVDEFKPLDTTKPCDTSTFSPHGEAVSPDIDGKTWQSCERIGVTTSGSPVYLGIVGAGYNYHEYYTITNGTLVVLAHQILPPYEIPNAVSIFNSLVPYTPTEARHN